MCGSFVSFIPREYTPLGASKGEDQQSRKEENPGDCTMNQSEYLGNTPL
jgi:hypothetical protein